MKKRDVLGVVGCILLTLSGINCHGQDNGTREGTGTVVLRDSVEYQGKLVKVRMTNFRGNPWQELGLEDENGNVLVILIGKKAEELTGKQGLFFKIQGAVKPGMTVKGENVPVIEIRHIQEVSG